MWGGCATSSSPPSRVLRAFQLRRSFKLADFCRPNKRGHDWSGFVDRLLVAPEVDVLMCMPDTAPGNKRNSNLLHTISQFPTVPETNQEGAPVLTAFKRSMQLVVDIYKRHGALDLCGGNYDDTAVCKACAVGSTFIVRLLVEAGASTSLPRLF